MNQQPTNLTSDVASTVKKTESHDSSLRSKSKVQKFDDSYQVALLELKEAQLKNEKGYRQLELTFKSRQVEIEETKIILMVKQAETDADESRVRIREAYAKTSKLYQEGQIVLLQRKVSLLRERKKLLDEGIGQARLICCCR